MPVTLMDPAGRTLSLGFTSDTGCPEMKEGKQVGALPPADQVACREPSLEWNLEVFFFGVAAKLAAPPNWTNGSDAWLEVSERPGAEEPLPAPLISSGNSHPVK